MIVEHVTERTSAIGGIALRDTIVAADCARCDATHVSRVTLSSAHGDHEERAAWDALADALCEGWALTADSEPVCVGCRTSGDCGVAPASEQPRGDAGGEATATPSRGCSGAGALDHTGTREGGGSPHEGSVASVPPLAPTAALSDAGRTGESR